MERTTALNVALVIPRSGSAGIYGPSCEACAELAIRDLNATTGLLGKQVRLIPVDGSRPPAVVAAEVARLVERGTIDAITGWHISPVRQAIARVTAGRVPYVYGPLYEGGERTPGLFLTGETPSRQLLPAMDWMKDEHGVDRWIVIGNDYIWPRQTGAAAAGHARTHGAPLVGEIYLPLGTEDFSAAIRDVERSAATGVVLLLVGGDGVMFNRQFAAAGLDASVPRLSPHVEENMLMASGSESNRGLFAAAGYFEALNTTASMDFAGHYYTTYGPAAPALNSIGESCYEAITLLIALVSRAGSLTVADLTAAAVGLTYISPRGEVTMRGNQMSQDVYVAEAIDLDFEVQARISAA
ncbi:substrate-binding domain-containing protein [Mycobacterium sp. CVI_P3]|uniref:Substrate-binding domain-containing protein n=1 Tax=Mycobacterium pinniadriaticum TaxID=2994102 RepID=A0ABT3SHY2_9MYCO|nr:substrate-binding domain-containing protein [Mycobacterium pinniadriaticum]MCX2932790.1 substrate-binding domain-containing protein [Mycobacterium pinniadriaticum]MCX2939150.1 substrate-binding domain-containing protein [Mycobacterium pinniadriaticum]